MGVALWPETEDALVPDEVFALTAKAPPHTEYQRDPVGWAVSKLGIPEHTLRWSLNPGYDRHRWDGSRDPLVQLYEAVAAWKDTGVESGTGTGKSFGVAVLILWFLACWEGARVFTFAPKEDQLRLYIWTEIGKLWPRFQAQFPSATLTDLCLRMRGPGDDSWVARGYAVGVKVGEAVSTKASGMHAEHMLLVYEEGPGIPPQVMEAGKNTCTAPHNVRVDIGNPNHQLDPLHKFCTEAGVTHVVMSALDHPNVVCQDHTIIPGAVSQVSIAKRLAQYGESSPIYQSRVRGLSPEQASDGLIRLEWLRAAAARYMVRKDAGTLPAKVTGKGVDVANSEHGDRACIVDFAENVCVRIDAFPCPDANRLGRQVSMEMQGASLADRRVGVDAIGVGAGTVNELRRLGRKFVTALYASGKPMTMTEKMPDGSVQEWSGDVNVFNNLRSQMHWQAREDLRNGVVDSPEDADLWEEALAHTFADDPKTVVESKDEVRERLGRSPDKWDAWVMANWVRDRSVQLRKSAVQDAKVADKALPLTVKDGKLVKPEQPPKTLDEWIERLASRKQNSRSVHRERMRSRK